MNTRSMKTLTKVAGVTLAAAALTGLGAGVAGATTVAPHAADQATATQGGTTFAYFNTTNAASDTLRIDGYDNAANFTGYSPAAGTVLNYADNVGIYLNTTGRTAASGVIYYTVLAPNGNAIGSFQETVSYRSDGSKLGARVVTVEDNTVPATFNHVNTFENDLSLTNAS